MVSLASKSDGLLKISDLARATGVSTGTIKFYIREGLLPPPTLKTGRNMAYYDRTFVDRIRCIRELQEKRFLPLNVIRAILDGDSSVISPHEIETLLSLEGTFYEAIQYTPSRLPIKRSEACARYAQSDQQIQHSIDAGVLTPVVREDGEYFEGDDILLLETFAALRKAGFSEDLFPDDEVMPMYVEVLKTLAHQELLAFSRGVTNRVSDAQMPQMALAAVKLCEQLIVLLRRKFILAELQELRLGSAPDATGTNGK